MRVAYRPGLLDVVPPAALMACIVLALARRRSHRAGRVAGTGTTERGDDSTALVIGACGREAVISVHPKP